MKTANGCPAVALVEKRLCTLAKCSVLPSPLYELGACNYAFLENDMSVDIVVARCFHYGSYEPWHRLLTTTIDIYVYIYIHIFSRSFP